MNKNDHIFFRTYNLAFRSGLVKHLGPVLWTTLQALATYMNAHGVCWPSQSKIAKELGVSRETVNARIRRLCAITWEGEPILVKEAQHEKRSGCTCRYLISPKSGLRIFNESKSSQVNSN